MRSKAILVALLAFAFVAQAAPVSEREARLAARAWAAASGRFGARLGLSDGSVREFALTNGASFFSVKMDGGGTVIVSGDNEDEPIVAMSSADISNPEVGSPLRDLLERDISARRNAVRPAAKMREAQRRWLRLMRTGEAMEAAGEGEVPASDVAPTDLRVPALVESKWGQRGHGENYYTPNKYVCGCVATAMAQIMRYHCFPVEPIAPFSATCYVDGYSTQMQAIGGTYDWANMPLLPTDGMSDVKEEAIGHLTYDCGVSVSMDWGDVQTRGGSGAFTTDVAAALKNRFHYANAEVSINMDVSTDESLRERIIYASLDAGSPVQLGICQMYGGNGHSVVADGYGYIDDVSYVHLNMGWSGQGDIWYHLPDITYVASSGGAAYKADTVSCCIYNIFPTETGVVISGRTLDDDGEVLPGASVAVYREGDSEPLTNITSSAYGVYAAIVPPNAVYTITAVADAFSCEMDVSVEDENIWGCDAVLSAPSVRVITSDGSDTNICSTLDRAVRDAATLVNPTIEIFAPTVLKRDAVVTNDCRIVAGPDIAAPAHVGRVANASITVGDGAMAVFSNILFEPASDVPVRATNGGAAAFEGVVSIGETLSVAADAPDGFALAGDIEGGIQVTVDDAMTNGAVFGFALCELSLAQANAAKIINPEDSSLGGEAFEGEGGAVLLRWAQVSVDPSAAVVACQDANGDWSYFRAFNDALVGDAVKIVLKKSSAMSMAFAPSRDVEICSENGAVLLVNKGAQFVAGTGVKISFSDIAMRGGSWLSASFISVEGGTVELKAGAVLEDMVTRNSSKSGNTAYRYGSVVVKSGELTMLSGSSITGCRALINNTTGDGGYGGGVYVCGGATLDMQGGKISGCYAQVDGGGVYADGNATVRLSGDATISGNTAGANGGAANDLRYRATSKPVVAGKMTGSVGIFGAPDSLNNDNAVFATAASGVSQSALGASAAAFFSNVAVGEGEVRTVVVDGNSLKWSVADAPTGPFPVTPAYDDDGFITNAVARVIRADSGAVDYWETATDAFLSIVGDATIELLDDDFFETSIVVTNNVVLRTAADSPNGAGFIALMIRAGECDISVVEGASLTVSDMDFPAWFGSGRLFNVNGGSLSLLNTGILYVYGSTDRAAAAIAVYGGGTVTLEDGSEICDCENVFVDEDTNSGAAAGIVAEDAGTTVFLSGCTISGCYARKTGGVFIGNEASVFVKGDVNIVDNSCGDDNSCGNMIVADGGHLYLDGELTGLVGCEEGIGGDANVFGVVTAQLTDAVIASATNLVHDTTHARGSVNGTDLVWNLAGRTPVAKPELPETTTFTYDKTLHVVMEDGEGYVVVSGGEGVDGGSYHAVARLEPGFVWEDGTSDAVVCDWRIAPAELYVRADNASKIAGDDDPPSLTYTVSGLAGDDDADDVISITLTRVAGEEIGTYDIEINTYKINPGYAGNYSFDPRTSFTPGVFTIIDSEGELLPPISDEATLEEILAALEGSGIQDERVIAAVTEYFEANPEGARTAYNNFRTWAKTDVGDALAVCTNENAWVSYEFGVSELFENTPTVIITSMAIEDPSTAAMRVTLVVKDGDAEKDVDPNSVAALFEMSADFKEWKSGPDYLTVVPNADGSYTVSPKDPSLTMAVIRVRY